MSHGDASSFAHVLPLWGFSAALSLCAAVPWGIHHMIFSNAIIAAFILSGVTVLFFLPPVLCCDISFCPKCVISCSQVKSVVKNNFCQNLGTKFAGVSVCDIFQMEVLNLWLFMISPHFDNSTVLLLWLCCTSNTYKSSMTSEIIESLHTRPLEHRTKNT